MHEYYSRISEIFTIIFKFLENKLLLLSPLFVQLTHTNYYKIVKQLESFKITIVAPSSNMHSASTKKNNLILGCEDTAGPK
jgi:hypothetical protein